MGFGRTGTSFTDRVASHSFAAESLFTLAEIVVHREREKGNGGRRNEFHSLNLQWEFDLSGL